MCNVLDWNYHPPLDDLLDGECPVMRQLIQSAGFNTKSYRQMLAETAKRLDGDDGVREACLGRADQHAD